MKLRGIALVVMIGLTVAAMPAAAAAKPGYYVSGRARTAKFKVRASNGYLIELQARATRNPDQDMYVVARKGSSSVTYGVPGSLAPDDSIDLHLPHVGRIAVHFDPVNVTRGRRFRNCTGRASVIEHGFFRGTIRLRGERDFTALNRTSVHGRMTQHFRQVCDNGESSGGHRREPRFSSTFLASGESHGFLGFLATESKFGDATETFFGAHNFGRREGMDVFTSISVQGGPGDFVVSPHGSLKFAEVKPPAPFEGGAAFNLTSPTTSTWEGDLAVELPGLGKVSLAGPDHWSSLCKDRRCSDTDPSTVVISAAH